MTPEKAFSVALSTRKFRPKSLRRRKVYRHQRHQPESPSASAHHSQKPIPTLFDLAPEDKDLMGHMMLLLPQLAQSQGLDGFKTQINTGESGGQEVFHIHIHLMGE